MKKDKKKLTSVALASVLAVTMLPVNNIAGSLTYGSNAVYAEEAAKTISDLESEADKAKTAYEAAQAEADKAKTAYEAAQAEADKAKTAYEAAQAEAETEDKGQKVTEAKETADKKAEEAKTAKAAADKKAEEAKTAKTAAEQAQKAVDDAKKAEAEKNAIETAKNDLQTVIDKANEELGKVKGLEKYKALQKAIGTATTEKGKTDANVDSLNEAKIKLEAAINAAKAQDPVAKTYIVTFVGDSHATINNSTTNKVTKLTEKAENAGKGIALKEFINAAGLKVSYDTGYKFKGYYIGSENVSENTVINGNTIVTIKTESTTDDLKEVTSYVKDEDVNGKYVSGKIDNKFNNLTLYVYYNNEKIGSATIKDGKFDIYIGSNYDNRDRKYFKYYVNQEAYDLRNYTRIYPKNVSLYDKKNDEYRKLKGEAKDYKDTKIYVYLNGKEIGNTKTDKYGDFDFTLSKYVDKKYSESDLKFYVESNNTVSEKAVVTRAIAGEKAVQGKAGSKAEVTVKDSKGNVLGKTTADSNGNFTVNVNRPLVGQEIITVLTKETGKTENKFDFIVVGHSSNGYIKGFEDGTFRPYNSMTRAEAAVMIARLVNGSDDFGTSQVTKFNDASNQWYSKAVNYVVQKGIVDGYPDGTFKPNQEITRAEFAKMISKYVNTTTNKTMNFSDVSSSYWAAAAINKAYSAGVVNGYPNGTFEPNKKINRAEAVTMLNKTFNKTASNYTNTFRDVNSSDWFYNDVMKAAN